MRYIKGFGVLVDVGRIGTEELTVHWLIHDVLSLSREGHHHFYASPVFVMGDEHWELRMWPSWNKEAESPESGWMRVDLCRLDGGPPKTFHVSIGMRGSGGVKKGREVEEEISGAGHYSFKDFCSMSELLDGVSTITCVLKRSSAGELPVTDAMSQIRISSPVAVPASQQRMAPPNITVQTNTSAPTASEVLGLSSYSFFSDSQLPRMGSTAISLAQLASPPHNTDSFKRERTETAADWEKVNADGSTTEETPASPTSVPSPPSNHSPLPPGWEERKTPTGFTYYLNYATQSTQWERPTGATQIEEEVQQRSLDSAQEFRRRVDQSDDFIYDHLRDNAKILRTLTSARILSQVQLQQVQPQQVSTATPVNTVSAPTSVTTDVTNSTKSHYYSFKNGGVPTKGYTAITSQHLRQFELQRQIQDQARKDNEAATIANHRLRQFQLQQQILNQARKSNEVARNRTQLAKIQMNQQQPLRAESIPRPLTPSTPHSQVHACPARASQTNASVKLSQPPVLNVEGSNEEFKPVMSLPQDSNVASVHHPITYRPSVLASLASDLASMMSADNILAHASQKSAGENNCSEKIEVDADIKNGSTGEGKTGSKLVTKEVNQERENVGYATRSSVQEEVVVNEEPAASQSVAPENDSDSKPGSSSEVSQRPPTLRSNKKGVEDFGHLLRTGEYSDAIVQVGEEEFSVHQGILSVRSPVLSGMFREKASDRISIDCKPDVFKQYLQHVYTGSVGDLSDQNALGLYRLAVDLKQHDLKQQCIQYIRNRLGAQAFCDIPYFPDPYSPFHPYSVSYNSSSLSFPYDRVSSGKKSHHVIRR